MCENNIWVHLHQASATVTALPLPDEYSEFQCSNLQQIISEVNDASQPQMFCVKETVEFVSERKMDFTGFMILFTKDVCINILTQHEMQRDQD